MTMLPTRGRVVLTGTTTRGTRTGTLASAPLVTTPTTSPRFAMAKCGLYKGSATLYPLRRIHIGVRITASSEISKAAPTFLIMGQKYRNLFEQITSRESLWAAYKRASLGKRKSSGFLRFKTYDAANIENIKSELERGVYEPGKSREFFVFEPKARKISALPFLDRVVQHSLHAALEPIFEKVFLPYSFACRKGKGVHYGVKHVQAILRRHKGKNLWCLKLDFKSYFHSIDRTLLWKEIEKKVKCQKTLNLLSLFHSRDGQGLPIGNLTSQLLANIYGHKLDRFIVHTLGVKEWARYMDDTVIFSESKDELEKIHERLTEFAEKEMRLVWSKWSIRPVSRGVNFLGYRTWTTYKLIRPDSVRRAKRKIKRYKERAPERLKKFVASWKGHIQWADCNNLKRKLLGDTQDAKENY